MVAELKERLAHEMRAALKEGQKVRLSTLRLLSASIKNREVELRRELTDDEVVDVAGREVKRRHEAIEAYERADRADRAAVEREELEVLQAYVPPPLTEEELDALVDDAIEQAGAMGMSDFGRVMGDVMARAKGRADGRAVQSKVRARLSGPA